MPIRITPPLLHLELARPSGIDLILTKMMRNDPQDMDDIRFLLEREKITRAHLVQAFAKARVPPVPEIIQNFQTMQPAVLPIAAGP